MLEQKALLPDMYDISVGHLFGDIWARPGLSLRDRQLVTLAGAARPRTGKAMGELGLLPDGAVACRKGRILAVGPTAEIRRSFSATKTIDAKGRVVPRPSDSMVPSNSTVPG